MPSVKFRKEDFQGKVPINPPGWYPLSVGEFTMKESRDKESMNFWGEFVIDGDSKFSGTPLRHCFNEKAFNYTGGAGDYLACFTEDASQFVGQEAIDVLKMTTGRKVQGYVEWDPEFSRNQIRDWRKAG